MREVRSSGVYSYLFSGSPWRGSTQGCSIERYAAPVPPSLHPSFLSKYRSGEFQVSNKSSGSVQLPVSYIYSYPLKNTPMRYYGNLAIPDRICSKILLPLCIGSSLYRMERELAQ